MLDRREGIAQILGSDVSRETLECLQIHEDLLAKWNPAINLVSPGTIPKIWERHVQDSVQVFNALSALEGLWLDFGSGGGFPGLVCAILAKEFRPNLDFTLVESDRRKCTFLSTVARETGLNIEVKAERIEDLPPQGASVISARAVADLARLIDYAFPHLSDDGVCVFPKGARAGEEISAAQAHWHFKLQSKPSITDSEAKILVLGEIERV